MTTHATDMQRLEAIVTFLEKNDPEPEDEELHYRELGAFQSMLERMNRGQNLLTDKQREWVNDCLNRHEVEWQTPAEANKDIPKGNPVVPLWDVKNLPEEAADEESTMISILDIKWGSYLTYEGPYFSGNQPFVLPSNPSSAEVALAVITATEGGSANAYNGYDRCISSLGYIQMCEGGQYSVSDMLGATIETIGRVPAALQQQLDNVSVTFKKNDKGRWRFFFPDDRGEVDRLQEQQQLFLLRSNGTKGSWDDGSKEYAKGWAAALASVYQDPDAIQAQVDFLLPRLMGFVEADALAMVFHTSAGSPPMDTTDPWTGAIRAAYLSFAANNPTIANNQVKAFFENTMSMRSRDICVGLLRQLTFGPKIAIYPDRYNKIRPVLEKVFSIDLPDFATDLAAWRVEANISPTDPAVYRLETVLDIQSALLTLGFDLGASGADGTMGPKTKQAIMTFQGQQGLTADGVVGANTRAALQAALESRSK